MKKLMLLGGSRFAIPVIEAVHRLGCRVVTCDYLPDNPAHRLADDYRNVSVVDREAVLSEALSLGIDGILSFACDPGVVTSAFVAERMGLPACGPLGSVRILQNKGLFRRFLAEHGFNVPRFKVCRDAAEATADADDFHWPVIVKPVDSAGSKGVRRVDGPDALRACAEAALRYSRSHAFIVEEYIAPKGFPSDSDAFYAGGKLRFMSFNCQRYDPSAENPHVPAAYQWPSTIPAPKRSALAGEVERLLGLLDMGDSLYNIEAREGLDGRVYIMECAPRGGGNRLAECLEFATGVPLVENAVHAALGMALVGLEQREPDGYWAEVILHSPRPGAFRGLRLSPEVESALFQRDLWIDPGTCVGGFSAANQAIGTLVLRFESEASMNDVMDHLDIHVLVEA